jgi:hypothetical protein
MRHQTETHQHHTIPSEILENQDLFSQQLQTALDSYNHYAKWADPYVTSYVAKGDIPPSPSWIEVQNYQLFKSKLWHQVYQEALSLTTTAFKETTDSNHEIRYTEYLLTLAHGINDTSDPLFTNFKNKLSQAYPRWVSSAASLVENLKVQGQADKANWYSAILKPHLEVTQELASKQEAHIKPPASFFAPAIGMLGTKFLLN